MRHCDGYLNPSITYGQVPTLRSSMARDGIHRSRPNPNYAVPPPRSRAFATSGGDSYVSPHNSRPYPKDILLSDRRQRRRAHRTAHHSHTDSEIAEVNRSTTRCILGPTHLGVSVLAGRGWAINDSAWRC